MTRLLGLVLLLAAVGCGGTPAPAPAEKKISWEEYRKLPAFEKDDPYVLQHLDDDSKAKLARAGKKNPFTHGASR
jgi:hypothetical protein